MGELKLCALVPRNIIVLTVYANNCNTKSCVTNFSQVTELLFSFANVKVDSAPRLIVTLRRHMGHDIIIRDFLNFSNVEISNSFTQGARAHGTHSVSDCGMPEQGCMQ